MAAVSTSNTPGPCGEPPTSPEGWGGARQVRSADPSRQEEEKELADSDAVTDMQMRCIVCVCVCVCLCAAPLFEHVYG